MLKTSLETIRLLAYRAMSQEIDRLLNKGFATQLERKNLTEMFKNYKDHEWNGDMDDGLEKVRELPYEAPIDYTERRF